MSKFLCLSFDLCLEAVVQLSLGCELIIPKLLFELVTKNLPKDCDLDILWTVLFDGVDNPHCPLNCETLQSILLVEVGVHVLLHCLNRAATFFTLPIVLDLGSEHLLNELLQLVKVELL